jgi:hypothetical protein
MEPGRYLIAIEQRHIDAGEPGECGKCPIALALMEAFPGTRVEVGDATIDFYDGDTPTNVADTPGDGEWFIARFDSGMPVSPCVLDLTIN